MMPILGSWAEAMHTTFVFELAWNTKQNIKRELRHFRLKLETRTVPVRANLVRSKVPGHQDTR